MYFRYIGHGDNAKSALLYSRINKLGHSHSIDNHDITSRTSCIFVANCDNYTASKMEQLLFNTFMYVNIDDKQEKIPTETEYNSYKKLIIFLGKKTLYKVMDAYNSKDTCIALREYDGVYRFVYFSKK